MTLSSRSSAKVRNRTVSLHLDKPGKEYLLVKPNQYDKQPSYFIFGGLVFMPLNQDVIDGMDGTPARIGALTYESPDETRSEAVIMTKVLPADINKDYHHDNDLLIEKVNGEKIRDFRDFFTKVQSSTADYITLETADDYQVVIDRKEAIEPPARPFWRNTASMLTAPKTYRHSLSRLPLTPQRSNQHHASCCAQ